MLPVHTSAICSNTHSTLKTHLWNDGLKRKMKIESFFSIPLIWQLADLNTIKLVSTQLIVWKAI